MDLEFLNKDSHTHEWIKEIAAAITDYLAADIAVGLNDGNLDKNFHIPADNYEDIESALTKTLAAVFDAIQNKTSLPMPISGPLLSFIVHQLCQRIGDRTGTIQFKYDFGAVNTVASEQAIHFSIFGKNGYFNRGYKHDVVEGVDYLRGRDYKLTKVIVGKEGRILGDPDIIERTLGMNQRVQPVGDRLYRLDGEDVDHNPGWAYMAPKVQLSTYDTQKIKDRMVLVDYPTCKPPTNLAAGTLLGNWLFSSDTPIAVRGFMEYAPPVSMATDIQRAVLSYIAAEEREELPQSLRMLPDSLSLAKLIELSLLGYNPYLISVGASDSNERNKVRRIVDTMMNVMRTSYVPTSLTESIRAHKSRMVVTRESNGSHTGLMMAVMAKGLTLDGPAGSAIGIDLLDGKYYEDIINGDDIASVEKTPGAADEEHVIDQLQLTNVYMKELLLQLGQGITTAPIMSFDNNKVPISVKYGIQKAADKEDSGCAALSFQVFTGFTDQELGPIVQLLSMSSPGAGLMSMFAPGSAMPDVVDDWNKVRALAVNTYLTEEFLEQEKVDKTFILALFQQIIKFFEFNEQFPENSSHCMQFLTMIRRGKTYQAMDAIARTINLPVSMETNTYLYQYGYRPSVIFHEPSSWDIAEANIVRNGKPLTAYGYLLSKLGEEGGLGFSTLLGPLIGIGQQALGEVIGSEAAGIIGGGLQLAASLIPI